LDQIRAAAIAARSEKAANGDSPMEIAAIEPYSHTE
jgi:hypothetical protein